MSCCGLPGQAAELARRYHLQFHRVTIADYPEDYMSRLADITPKQLRQLRLRALEIHDLVLAKLGRNSPRDRADVEFLSRKGALDRQILQERFDSELRPYVLNEKRDLLTLGLWLDELFGNGEQSH